MEIDVKVSELDVNVGHVRLQGRLAIDSEAQVLPTIEKAIDDSPAGVVIDMSAVDFVSSAGLRTLLSAFKKANAAGKKMAICRPQPEVYKLFKLASMATMFNVAETEADAIKAVSTK